MYKVFGAYSKQGIDPSVKVIPIMQEFSDVFFDNFSRLAPKREVEFSIKLALRITTISKAPYKMTLIKI